MKEQRVWHRQQKKERSEFKEANIIVPQEESSPTPKSKKRSFSKKLLYSPLSFYKKCCKSPSEANDALKVNAKAAIGQRAWTQREG